MLPKLPTRTSLLTTPGSPFIHRDLSWLQFNERVLMEAVDRTNPLLERLKFLAISSSNLDEFFSIRVATINSAISQLTRKNAPARVLSVQQGHRNTILKEVRSLKKRQGEVLAQLKAELKAQGIEIHRIPTAKAEVMDAALAVFRDRVFPELTQPSVLKIKDLGELGNLQVAAIINEAHWILLPKSLPPTLVAGHRLFFLDDLILQFLPQAFHMAGPCGLIRLTRDGEVAVDLEDEDTESIPEVIHSGIRRRDRGRPVRIQTAGVLKSPFLKQVTAAFKIDPVQVFSVQKSSLFLHGLWSGSSQFPKAIVESPLFSFPSRTIKRPGPLAKPESLMNWLDQHDVLLHHPYDSFGIFISWIEFVCKDPQVEQISMTVYRTDASSPIIESLKAAAKTKKVRVIIELRARFDELNNLRLAEELRREGVEVFYGFSKLKVHAKIAIIQRREKGELRLYSHLSTGNYHSGTARQYTDLAILTSNPTIGADAMTFFDRVSEGVVPLSFKVLLSAPTRLHKRLQSLIEAEIKATQSGKSGRIFAKMNALVDENIIQSLYRASNAGVRIDLVVRGACSLIPGVPGLSQNIRVLSIVDRYLEHSRIYYFESSRSLYLSSADWMPRNFFSRLEIAFPVLSEEIYAYIRDFIIPTYLSDTAKARELTAEGVWKPVQPSIPGLTPLRSQARFEELALTQYRGTPLRKFKSNLTAN